MGIFDSLFANARCPVTGLELEVEIQFKFGDSCLNQYHLGDQLDVGPYGNLWIPEAYVCDQCSTYEEAPMLDGSPSTLRSIKDLVLHDVFIHLDQGKFLEVLTEKEFKKRYVVDGKPSLLPERQMLWIPHARYDRPLFNDDGQMSLFDAE